MFETKIHFYTNLILHQIVLGFFSSCCSSDWTSRDWQEKVQHQGLEWGEECTCVTPCEQLSGQWDAGKLWKAFVTTEVKTDIIALYYLADCLQVQVVSTCQHAALRPQTNSENMKYHIDLHSWFISQGHSSSACIGCGWRCRRRVTRVEGVMIWLKRKQEKERRWVERFHQETRSSSPSYVSLSVFLHLSSSPQLSLLPSFIPASCLAGRAINILS